ncbi:hypothetical protein Tco_0215663 [Tanacetum coccineum]
MNPSSKHKLVPYLRFTKLIVQHSLAKFLDIPRRTNEPSHTVEDDVVVGFMIASGNVEAKGEETDEITDLHQILEEVLLIERGDGVVSIKRRITTDTRPSSTHIPQAYTKAVYLNPRNQNEPPKEIPFTFRKRTSPDPQSQALGTTFEARVQDYMAAHTERMERFENTIFKQREEINDRMAEMFRLLKELMTSRTPEKVLIREDAKSPITKNVNYISIVRRDEEISDKDDIAADGGINETNIEVPVKEAEKENKAEDGTKNEPIKKTENEEAAEVPSSQPIGYYLKHKINEKLIEGLVDNHRFNDSLSGVRVGKVKGKTYNVSPRGLAYEVILKKKITRKEDIGGNFGIPFNIGSLKHMNALVDQGSDVNGMPLSTYMKLTDERPAETDIRLSLASHSYIYPFRNSRGRIS